MISYDGTYYKLREREILSSVWKSNDDNIGVYVVNYNLDDKTVNVQIDMDEYQIPRIGEYGVYRVLNNDYENVATFSDDFTLSFAPARLSSDFYEFIKLPYYATFDGTTTDFRVSRNIKDVNNAVLEKVGFGAIEFINEPIDFSSLDLDGTVSITTNNIVLPGGRLDRSASLLLSGLSFVDPLILKDGVECPANECRIVDYSNGELMFTVLGSGQYSAEEDTCSDDGECTPPDVCRDSDNVCGSCEDDGDCDNQGDICWSDGTCNPPGCGDGFCDGANGETCGSCFADCDVDGNGNSGACCGDNVAQGNEECDGADNNACDIGGGETCTPSDRKFACTCKYERSACTNFVEDGGIDCDGSINYCAKPTDCAVKFQDSVCFDEGLYNTFACDYLEGTPELYSTTNRCLYKGDGADPANDQCYVTITIGAEAYDCAVDATGELGWQLTSGLTEVCDDGYDNNCDGRIDEGCVNCGDDFCDGAAGESCDSCYGDCDVDGDGNSGACCGDGTEQGSESCDDGANGDDTDQCYDDCTVTFCGDNIKQDPNGEDVEEECDGSDDTLCPGNCQRDCTCGGGPDDDDDNDDDNNDDDDDNDDDDNDDYDIMDYENDDKYAKLMRCK